MTLFELLLYPKEVFELVKNKFSQGSASGFDINLNYIRYKGTVIFYIHLKLKF